MSNKKFYEDGTFWSGVGLYYIFVWIFAFYPSFIISIAFKRMFFGTSEDGDMLGLLVMVIGTIVILCLVAAKQYFIILVIYAITAWPFINVLIHWCNASDSEMYPVPLDWWPLW